jgi:hypothetical protein
MCKNHGFSVEEKPQSKRLGEGDLAFLSFFVVFSLGIFRSERDYVVLYTY